MSKRILFFVAAALATVLTPICWPAEEEYYAIIMQVQGQVEVKEGGGEWKSARAGQVLHERDEIRTGDEGTAKILLHHQGATGDLDLHPKSRLRFNEMKRDLQTGEKSTILDLAIGSVLVHAEKLQAKSEFKVRTPNSTTGVKGTKFLITADVKEMKES